MIKEYDHFEKVEDISGFKKVHRYDFEMEDRRSYHPANIPLNALRLLNEQKVWKQNTAQNAK